MGLFTPLNTSLSICEVGIMIRTSHRSAFHAVLLWHLPHTSLRAVLSRLRPGTPAELSQGAVGWRGEEEKLSPLSTQNQLPSQTAREELSCRFMLLNGLLGYR